MITNLHVSDEEIAKKILNVQIPAYKIEAEIIHFYGIPQLKDTVETIRTCNENFLGYMLDEELAGVISYTVDQNHMEICRLVVHPNHFRKGIARSLVGYVIENVAKGKKTTVSTGAKNIPAKKLYSMFGFIEVQDIEVAPNVFITLLEK
ncbi:N-acetyltransferase [Brevibacillus halotolerans]|uniref:Acetyltransferase n=1 Tax=Brevibacillus laterosporus TaxID=1465 RepID=A0A0F6Y070_BRELA|nr:MULTISPECIES: GNAT family N-acetyltransferase [Brevibacillus]AKF95011.1 acetyltransferase [Brevibacillus laterosporus]GIO02276.1 N-acetyltransferase [Brevibacillus halotolerans]